MLAEVQEGLLDHTFGKIGAERLSDIAGQVDDIGVRVNLGQVHRHPDWVGRLGRTHRRGQEKTQIDRIGVRDRNVRSVPNSPLGHQNRRRDHRVETDPAGRANIEQTLALLAGKPAGGRRHAYRLWPNPSFVAL